MKDEEHCFCVSCSNFEQLRHAVLNTFCDHDDADQYGEHIANTTNSLDAARDAVRASPSHVFVPPPPDILFCTTPCHCVTCDGLSTAYQQAMGCWFELPGNVGALSDRLQHACEQIDDVARLLQRQHKPEIYDSSPTALQTLKEKPTTQRESYLTVSEALLREFNTLTVSSLKTPPATPQQTSRRMETSSWYASTAWLTLCPATRRLSATNA